MSHDETIWKIQGVEEQKFTALIYSKAWFGITQLAEINVFPLSSGAIILAKEKYKNRCIVIHSPN